MVHALDRARRWLVPRGLLIDIRPTPEAAHLEVGFGPTIVRAGDLADFDAESGPRRRHTDADAAVAAAVAGNWFVLEQRREFTFLRHADAVAELQQYVKTTWKNSRLEDETVRRAEELLTAHAGATVWLREQVSIARLRPVAS